MKKHISKIGGVCGLFVALLSLVGCTLHPVPIESRATLSEDQAIIEVVLRSADGLKIKQREMYFSIVLLDCGNNKRRFPIVPYVAGERASSFSFPVEEESLRISGKVPMRILRDFPSPCIRLEGGSYVFGRLESSTIPLSYIADE